MDTPILADSRNMLFDAGRIPLALYENVARFEVNNELYLECMNAIGSNTCPPGFGQGDIFTRS